MRELIEKGAARECGDAETIESALKLRFPVRGSFLPAVHIRCR